MRPTTKAIAVLAAFALTASACNAGGDDNSQSAVVPGVELVRGGLELPEAVPLRPDTLDQAPRTIIEGDRVEGELDIDSGDGSLTFSLPGGADGDSDSDDATGEGAIGPVVLDDLTLISTAGATRASSLASPASVSDPEESTHEWPMGNRNLARTGNAAWEEFIDLPLDEDWRATERAPMSGPAVMRLGVG